MLHISMTGGHSVQTSKRQNRLLDPDCMNWNFNSDLVFTGIDLEGQISEVSLQDPDTLTLNN